MKNKDTLKFFTLILLWLIPTVEAAPLRYLKLDNESIASSEELIEDPFLIFRTKSPFQSSGDAWKRMAQVETISAKGYDSDNGCESSDILLPYSQDVSIANVEPVFDHIPLCFTLRVDMPNPDKVWWQISHKPDFSFLLSNFDVIQDFSSIITLDLLDETFFNPHQEYFFRGKVSSVENPWGHWSVPFPFQMLKPISITDAHFKKVDESHFDLIWEEVEADTYLIFGSNSIDFIPSIYEPLQVDALIHGEIIESKPSNNFIGETKDPHYVVDGKFAYYRVIAKHRGQFSNPSAIIPFYDNSIHHERNALQLQDPISTIAQRLTLPSAYPWTQEYTKPLNEPKYVKNPSVSEEVWQQVHPYFLPDNHPAKKTLDHIFSQSRVLESSNAMKQAGFKLNRNTRNTMIVASHPKLKGYLIKAYLDNENMGEWAWWKKRVEGAITVQKSIDNHGYQNILKVPKKWIYPLPPKPTSKASNPRNFILLVEDMKIVNSKKNLAMYKKKATRPMLDALFTVIAENLLIDSVYVDNVPFAKDGRIAFIDIEHFNDITQPLRLYRFAQYLSPEMYTYWESLLISGGPSK